MKERLLYRFDYIESADKPLHHRAQLLSPLTLTTRQTEDWSRLNKQFNVVNEFFEDSFFLMSGVINLINTVEDRQKRDKPIDTLVFMDKSGRLAAYMLYTAYHYLSRHRGEAGEQIASHKPKIRFVNIGKEDMPKHGDSAAIGILSTVYNKKDLKPGHTLIVDEFVGTGGSIRRAGNALKAAGYLKRTPATGMFWGCPSWYDHGAVKGVRDPEYISLVTRTQMENLYAQYPEYVREVAKIVRQYGLKTTERAFDESGNPVITNLPPEIEKSIHTLRRTFTSPNEALKYLISAGGFLSIPLAQEKLAVGYAYRKKLKAMIYSAFEQDYVVFAEPVA